MPHRNAPSEPIDESTPGIIRAAGGLVSRLCDGVQQVLIVHRQRYDDWSYPKGKLDPGEKWKAAAVREVFEETGYRCVTIGPAAARVTYLDHKGRPKLVRYWRMSVVSGDFVANDEVDAIRWVPPAQVGDWLTYDLDRRIPLD